MGAQDLALKQLKEKLAQLGYFAPERKRSLPRFPRHIALVTSASGAAIRDILEILGRRWPAAQVWACPVRVQGLGAAEDIAAAIRRVNRLPEIEVLILGRGGGSSEDLAAFNREVVAQAIFASRVPVVSAVGHEIDVTIADLVADKRALTPSEAAELVTPDGGQLLGALQACHGRMRDLLLSRFQTLRGRLQDLTGRRTLAQPLERIRERERRLDDSEARLHRAIQQKLATIRHLADAQAARLETLSPLNVLARGYSLTRRETDQAVVRNPDQVQVGDRVVTLVERGRLLCRVEKKG
jgi:exodeoxyribonuclease VII large subunit